MLRYFVVASLLLGTTLVMAAQPAKLSSRDRLASEGYALVRGPQFGIQVKLVETKPSPNRLLNLYVYDYVVTDNATGKIHGGRGANRLEASVDDMHKPARWQFRDLDGDGYTDFRYYKGDGRKSHGWWAEVWQPARKRFMFNKDFTGK